MTYRDRDLALQPASIYGMFEFNTGDGTNTTGTLSNMNPPGSRLIFPTDGIDSSICVSAPDSTAGNYLFSHANPTEFFTENAHLIGSITGWFRRPAFDVFNTFLFVGNAGGDGIQVDFNNSQTALRARWLGVTAVNIDTVDLSSRINEWIHFAVTWSSSDGHRLYIDGIEVGNGSWFGGFSTLSIDTAYLMAGTGFGNTPKIDLDQITYRNIVLTPQEIADLVGSQPIPVPPPVLIDGENQPPANVVIYNRVGLPIAQIKPEISYITFLRNKVSKAPVNIPKSDYDPEIIKPLNRISIQYENGLPFWAGLILFDFDFSRDTVSFMAYSGEQILSHRQTDRGRYFTNRTIGTMATNLLNEANAILPTGIELGEIWTGGNTHSPSYHLKSLLKIYEDSLFWRLSRADFWVEPFLNAEGLLRFRLNVLQQRGTEKPGLALFEGRNVTDPINYRWSGRLVNEWTIAGRGNGWGADRPIVTVRNQSSIDRYGLVQGTEIHQNIENTATLTEVGENLLFRTSEPYRTIALNQIDKEVGSFSNIKLGDVIPVYLPSYDIDDLVEIMGKSYYPATGKLDIVMRLV